MPYIKKFNVDRTLPLEEQMNYINNFMRRSCKLRAVHKALMDALDTEFVKAFHFKRNLEIELTEIRKIPTPKKGQRSKPSLTINVSGKDLYNQMTDEQKEEIKKELLGG